MSFILGIYRKSWLVDNKSCSIKLKENILTEVHITDKDML